MKKALVFFALFGTACAIAGLYGMIHNQISYSVSPEYFTKFKFAQFGIADALPDRIGASLVGLYATWWMGLVVGIVLIPLGLVIPTWNGYFKGMVRVFLIVCLTAFLIGLGALAYGALFFTDGNISASWYPEEVENKRAFAQAGNMHNFSYLGGMIGLATGGAWIFVERRRVKKSIRIAEAKSICIPQL